MKTLTLAFLTAQLFAGSFDPKLLKLIGPKARGAFGMDAERHRHSALNELFPASSSALQSIVVINGTGGALSINIGESDDDTGVVLDTTTRIVGDGVVIEEAVQAWLRTDLIPTPLAMRAQQLSGLYDNWFVILKPLDLAVHSETPSPLKYRDEMIQAIEEISGGIRFGGNIAFKLEALMHSEDDAKALAAVGQLAARAHPGRSTQWSNSSTR